MQANDLLFVGDSDLVLFIANRVLRVIIGKDEDDVGVCLSGRGEREKKRREQQRQYWIRGLHSFYVTNIGSRGLRLTKDIELAVKGVPFCYPEQVAIFSNVTLICCD